MHSPMKQIATIAVLALVSLVSWCPAQNGRELRREFRTLDSEYRRAKRTWSKNAGERADDPNAPNEGHPARAFLPRFQALATRCAGTPEAALPLLWIAEHEHQDPDAAAAAIDTLITDLATSRRIQRLPVLISWAAKTRGYGLERARDQLRTLAGKAGDPEVKAKSHFYRATLCLDSRPDRKASDDVHRDLKAILEVAPQSRTAYLAKNILYEVTHLDIGTRAPEIEGEDLTGKPFKLTDYRGKVVLLHFWAHW